MSSGNPTISPPVMRVLHVMPSMDPVYGGPVAAMHMMALGLSGVGVSVDVVTVQERPSSSPDLCGIWQPADGFRLICFPLQSRYYRISHPLSLWLRDNLHHYDLVHVHGVFTYPSLVARRRAIQACRPFIVRPLGILNRWGMEQRRPWLKQFFFRMIEKPSLDRAGAMHFTSEDEARDVSRLKIRGPSVVIPLGLDLRPYEKLPPASLFHERFPVAASGRVILFLSRIDQKKGLDLLIPAFKQVLAAVPDVILVIAGNGSPEVVDALKASAENVCIQGRVVWTGFLEGDLRLAAFAAARVFCLPSRSENFGMALLEAMAAGLPCVSTDQVALAVEAFRSDAVSLADLGVQSLADALVELLGDDGRCLDLGSRAKQYAEAHHSMNAVGSSLKKLYEELIDSSTAKEK